MPVEVARAKVNLALHVLGRRDDGYHELDSIVAFADIGDRLSFEPASRFELIVDGPFAADVPRSEDNLVLRAAKALGGTAGPARILLTKNLPVASGIGGGSADAAATIRGLTKLAGVWPTKLLGDSVLDPSPAPLRAGEGARRADEGPRHAKEPSSGASRHLLPFAIERMGEGSNIQQSGLMSLARSLGADVPVCLVSRACRMTGIGEKIARLDGFTPLHAVLVNPRVPLATPAVFAELGLATGQAAKTPVASMNAMDWRNDLESPASRLAPVIGELLQVLRRQAGLQIARMSGSGATCFGLFATPADAAAAAETIRTARPSWWTVATTLR